MKSQTKKRTSNKQANQALSTCPINGAGWCPYPFSVAQLQERLKRKQQESTSKEKTRKQLVGAKA